MLRACLVLFLFAAGAPAAGQGAAPPLPPERPPELAGPAPAPDVAVPLPPERPRDLAAPATTPDEPRTAAEPAAAPPPDDDPGCPERLAKLGVRARPLPAIADGSCGTPSPHEVSGLPDGVAVTPPVTLTCRAAEALALWSRDVVTPAADRELSTAPARIAIGTSYQCRSQNHRTGAKLSEHAYANGVDVAGFEFFKRAPITVGKADPEGPDGRFAEAVRSGACKFFTTVLGPGSDAEHGDHLHLDLRQRRNGFRICQ